MDDTRDEQAPLSDLQDGPTKRRTAWDDPEVPVGNAPPLPRWPLALTGSAWVAWIVFLVVMAVRQASGTH